MRCDAELFGIPIQISVTAKTASGQFFGEASQEFCGARREVFRQAVARVDVVEIKNVRGKQMSNHFRVKVVFGCKPSLVQSFDVGSATHEVCFG